ncbi:MAG: arylsulfatase [Chthoniobacteraceae bacterium]
MKHLLILTLILSSCCIRHSTFAAGQRPNIVFLLADDLGNADVGWHGSDIKTPNLDKLAASGAKLEHFYVMPVCTPTRVAFLTGRYPIRSGMQLNVLRPNSQYGLPLEERTIANALHDAGYTTAICGKWHVGHFDKAYWPNARGFDRWLGHLEGIDYFTHHNYVKNGKLDWHRDGEDVIEEGYATTLEANEAARLIRQQPGDKPLFLYVPFTGVHGPLLAPSKESVAAYQPAMNERRATLAAAVTAVDEGCGRILAALDETGRRNNTLIIFCSDNGGMPPGINLPYRAFKSSLYEGGIRSPAIAAWPGHIKPGTVVTEPLHIVDLFATFVIIADGTLDQKLPLDGSDIMPVLTEGRPSPHEDILLNAVTRNDGALRMGDWKLILNGNDGVSPGHDLETGERTTKGRKTPRAERTEQKVELFNLRDDPGETKDLAAEHPEKVKELRRRYDAYLKVAVRPLQLQNR